MKQFSLISILYSLFFAHSILLSADTLESSANNDIFTFIKEHSLTIKVTNNRSVASAGAGYLLMLAAQSPRHARAVMLTTHFLGETTRGKHSNPSPIQLLAGFAQIPCNKNNAKSALALEYTRSATPPAEQQPFTDIDEHGCWKRLPLPGHLAAQSLPEELKNYTLPADLDIGPLPDRSSTPTKRETTEFKSCCCIQ